MKRKIAILMSLIMLLSICSINNLNTVKAVTKSVKLHSIKKLKIKEKSKISKLKVKVKNKKIVAVIYKKTKKNKATICIQGKKKGTTKITVTYKVKKKKKKKTYKIKVKGSSTQIKASSDDDYDNFDDYGDDYIGDEENWNEDDEYLEDPEEEPKQEINYSIYAGYSDTTKTLTFSNDAQDITSTVKYGNITEKCSAWKTAADVPWNGAPYQKVNIRTEIYPKSTAYWFSGKSIELIQGLENLHTEETTNMQGMFMNSTLKWEPCISLDLRTDAVTDMSMMFKGITIPAPAEETEGNVMDDEVEWDNENPDGYYSFAYPQTLAANAATSTVYYYCYRGTWYKLNTSTKKWAILPKQSVVAWGYAKILPSTDDMRGDAESANATYPVGTYERWYTKECPDYIYYDTVTSKTPKGQSVSYQVPMGYHLSYYHTSSKKYYPVPSGGAGSYTRVLTSWNLQKTRNYFDGKVYGLPGVSFPGNITYSKLVPSAIGDSAMENSLSFIEKPKTSYGTLSLGGQFMDEDLDEEYEDEDDEDIPINAKSWNTRNVTTMKEMFSSAKISGLTLSPSFNTGNVTTMESMFYDMQSLQSLTLGKFFITNKCKNFNSMFNNCLMLKYLDIGEQFSLPSGCTVRNMFARVGVSSLYGNADIYPENRALYLNYTPVMILRFKNISQDIWTKTEYYDSIFASCHYNAVVVTTAKMSAIIKDIKGVFAPSTWGDGNVLIVN